MNEINDSAVAGPLADETRRFLTSNRETARRYLRQSWLSEAMRSLREARQQSGLTQKELAQRLNTTQSAIARLERDDEGRLALHRYVDYALACDRLPFDIGLESLENIRAFAIAHAEAPRTEHMYRTWCNTFSGATTPAPATPSATQGGGKSMNDLMTALGNSIRTAAPSANAFSKGTAPASAGGSAKASVRRAA